MSFSGFNFAHKFTRVPRGRLVLSVATLLIGLLLSLLAWQQARTSERLERERSFDMTVADIVTGVQDRFATYQQVLRGGVGLFEANTEVQRGQWRRYVDSLQLSDSYPGIQALGYAAAFAADELEGHQAAVRAEGFPDYRVHPADARGFYTAVVYLEPFDWRNVRSFGYDMFSHPVRREAMSRAMDTGQSALSGAVYLLQETEVDTQYGALLFLPVYRGDAALGTVAERREALAGFVYGAFRVRDLLRGTLAEAHGDIALELFDLPPGGEPVSMYADWAGGGPALMQRDVIVDIAGREWRIRLTAAPAFFHGLSSDSGLILGGGLLISVLLFAILLALSLSETRAVELSDRMTTALQLSEARQVAIVEYSPSAILTISNEGVVGSCNRMARNVFRRGQRDIEGQDFAALFNAASVNRIRSWMRQVTEGNEGTAIELREAELVTPAGKAVTVELSLANMGQSESGAIVALVSDITERKEAERKVREADLLRQEILHSSPVSIIATDAEGLIQSMNPAAEQLLGVNAAEMVGRRSIASVFVDGEADSRDGLPPDLLRGLFVAYREGSGGETETEYRRGDGSSIMVSQTVAPLFSPGGELTGYLVIAHDITERKEHEATIHHLAHHDALTELPNRLMLEKEMRRAIKQAERHHSKVGLLMLDIDHFKRINDSLGHDVGDQLLVVVAERLNGCLREADTVSRTGGDEFVILLPDANDYSAVSRIAEKVIDTISVPVRLGDHELQITPSIGVSLYPDDGTDFASLLKSADIAMYTAKDAGRGTFRAFDAALKKKLEERVKLEADLRSARIREEFEVHLQPQYDIQSGKLVGAEALLRWLPANREPISPDVFVPIIEETGDILAIGAWVLRESCNSVARIRNAGAHDFCLSVNVSPRQFWRRSMLHEVRDALKESNLPPSALTLEITEGVLIKNYAEVAQSLAELRELGVNVAVDDFGTGYSSLSYLTKFPINVLKIDQTFVRDISTDRNDAAVVSAIIAMAHSLQLRVVAEGVETEEQLDFLRTRGCDQGQGYFFGRAINADILCRQVSASFADDAAQRPGEPQPAVRSASA